MSGKARITFTAVAIFSLAVGTSIAARNAIDSPSDHEAAQPHANGLAASQTQLPRVAAVAPLSEYLEETRVDRGSFSVRGSGIDVYTATRANGDFCVYAQSARQTSVACSPALPVDSDPALFFEASERDDINQPELHYLAGVVAPGYSKIRATVGSVSSVGVVKSGAFAFELPVPSDSLDEKAQPRDFVAIKESGEAVPIGRKPS